MAIVPCGGAERRSYFRTQQEEERMKLLKSPGPRKNARFRGGDLSPLADTWTDGARFFIGLCKLLPRRGEGMGRRERIASAVNPGKKKNEITTVSKEVRIPPPRVYFFILRAKLRTEGGSDRCSSRWSYCWEGKLIEIQREKEGRKGNNRWEFQVKWKLYFDDYT